MRDRFGRVLDTLRISVTDRCNLECRYCAHPDGVPPLPEGAMLSYEEIAEVARVAAGMGVSRLRLTGGEPLLRRDLRVLVSMLAALPGVEDLALTTNGLLLEEHARALAEAGLRRVNVSLDALDPDRYRRITGGGDVRRVLAGIAAAREAGLDPVKLNCVVEAGSDEPDARDVARWARENGLEVRFIRRMDLRSGTFSVVEGGRGGDCPRCDRLRLTGDGFVRPCLFSDLAFSVRELGAREALERAAREKPRAGRACLGRGIRSIGG